MGRNVWIGGGCGVGALALAGWMIISSAPRQPQTPASKQPHPSASSDKTAEGSARLRELAGSERLSEVRAEDNAWDALSKPERMAHLRNEFAHAVRELEAGVESPEVVARAQGALSELRAQMYSTEMGRTKHQALEEQLAQLTERTEGDALEDVP